MPEPDQLIDEKLHAVPESDYGENYRAHGLEIYKLYLEMADRISARRQAANSFFLTVNTAIIGVVTYVGLGKKTTTPDEFYWLVSLSGMVLCYAWYRIIRSYKDLNSGKFKVVHRLEATLPFAPYDAEWEALGRGEDPEKYLPFTHVEMRVPLVFGGLHLAVLLRSFPWEVFGPSF